MMPTIRNVTKANGKNGFFPVIRMKGQKGCFRPADGFLITDSSSSGKVIGSTPPPSPYRIESQQGGIRSTDSLRGCLAANSQLQWKNGSQIRRFPGSDLLSLPDQVAHRILRIILPIIAGSVDSRYRSLSFLAQDILRIPVLAGNRSHFGIL